MDFDLNDEQRLLRDSVDRMVADRYGFEARRTHRAGPEGWSRDVWRQFAELGVLGLPFAAASAAVQWRRPSSWRRSAARWWWSPTLPPS